MLRPRTKKVKDDEKFGPFWTHNTCSRLGAVAQQNKFTVISKENWEKGLSYRSVKRLPMVRKVDRTLSGTKIAKQTFIPATIFSH